MIQKAIVGAILGGIQPGSIENLDRASVSYIFNRVSGAPIQSLDVIRGLQVGF